MVDVTKLNLSVREKVGTNAARRLRKEGRVPANLYGHGKPSASLSVDRRELADALGGNAQFMEVTIDGESDTALIREIQYDTYGLQVLHIDFERANIDEPIEISVPIILRGRSKGVQEGGILERFMDHMEIKVAPRYMPETFEVSVAALEIGDSILVGSVEIPESAVLVDDPERPICAVLAPRVEAELVGEGAEVAAGEEPEVVGGKKPDEEPAE
ncbi:MAG: 50S ribosomal protein L25 [Planctomycetota bacterium]